MNGEGREVRAGKMMGMKAAWNGQPGDGYHQNYDIESSDQRNVVINVSPWLSIVDSDAWRKPRNSQILKAEEMGKQMAVHLDLD